MQTRDCRYQKVGINYFQKVSLSPLGMVFCHIFSYRKAKTCLKEVCIRSKGKGKGKDTVCVLTQCLYKVSNNKQLRQMIIISHRNLLGY